MTGEKRYAVMLNDVGRGRFATVEDAAAHAATLVDGIHPVTIVDLHTGRFVEDWWKGTDGDNP